MFQKEFSENTINYPILILKQLDRIGLLSATSVEDERPKKAALGWSVAMLIAMIPETIKNNNKMTDVSTHIQNITDFEKQYMEQDEELKSISKALKSTINIVAPHIIQLVSDGTWEETKIDELGDKVE